MPRRTLVVLVPILGLLLSPGSARAAAPAATSAAPAKAAATQKPTAGKTGRLMDKLQVPKVAAVTLDLPPGFWKRLGITPRFEPGQWFQYRQSRPNAAPTMIHLGVIPSKRFHGPRDHLVELRVTEPTGIKTWLKLVMRSGPQGGTTVRKLMIEYATMPPIELPLDEPGKGSRLEVDPTKHSAVSKLSTYTFEHLGTETLEVPAGTFRVRHLRIVDRHAKKGHRVRADVWVSAKVVPLIGIVKMTSPDGKAVVLTGHGTGAVTDLPPFAPDAKPRRQGKGKDRVK